ncbi:MAG: hypothetical protein GEU74_08245 [Nitriliruptorales bacterium]|nr:hypothetical protein [Nitriliruptorales bacterium]
MSSPPAPEPPDPLQAWLEAAGGASAADPDSARPSPDARPRPSRRLLGATAVVCTLAAALAAWSPALRSVPQVGSERQGSDSAEGRPPATASAAPNPGVPPAPDGDAALPDDLPTLAAAVIAVRLAGAPDRYVDTAVAEAVVGAQGVSIVTVRAVVLERNGNRWGEPHLARFAVAVRGQPDAPKVLARPWRLPVEDASQSPSWEPVAELDAAAVTALEASGYREPLQIAVRRSRDLPDVLSVLLRGVAPGESSPRRHEVWLSRDATQVLGAAEATAGIPVPLEKP